jgi:hypothetical protein
MEILPPFSCSCTWKVTTSSELPKWHTWYHVTISLREPAEPLIA